MNDVIDARIEDAMRRNKSCRAAALELGIPRSTLRGWLARRAEAEAAENAVGITKASRTSATPVVMSPVEGDDGDNNNGGGGDDHTESPGAAEARTLEFRRQFDRSYIIPEAVRKGIKSSLTRQRWMSDADFQKACGVANAMHWKAYARENAEFEHLRLKIPGSGTLIWAYTKSYRDQLLGKALS